MKTIQKLTVTLLLLVAPALLHADGATDRKIEAAAKESYNYRTVLANHVQVKVADGVVTLRGTVPDADQRTLAEDTVRNLPGVVHVNNLIDVEPGAPEYSDGWIGTKIHTKLLVASHVSSVDTKVDVRDGVVTLTGRADSTAQKELTTAIVQEIAGVKSVKNQLVVTPPSVDASRTFGDRMDDASITAQVKYALLTHKSTSALQTNVTTTDGVVVIEGDASSGAEKELVTRLAQAVHGVRNVNNQMVVKS